MLIMWEITEDSILMMASLVWASQRRQQEPDSADSTCSRSLNIQSGWDDVTGATANESRRSGRRQTRKWLGAAADHRPRPFFHAYIFFFLFAFFYYILAHSRPGGFLYVHVCNESILASAAFEYFLTHFSRDLTIPNVVWRPSGAVGHRLFMESRAAWSFPSSTSRVVLKKTHPADRKTPDNPAKNRI